LLSSDSLFAASSGGFSSEAWLTLESAVTTGNGGFSIQDENKLK